MRLAVFAAAFTLVASTAAFAGASSSNFGEPQPDPKTRTMNRYEAKLWVFDGCLISQSRLQGTTREASLRASLPAAPSSNVRSRAAGPSTGRRRVVLLPFGSSRPAQRPPDHAFCLLKARSLQLSLPS